MREHRVYGPPGCGKTTYLAAQVERAAEKYGVGGVMVASLTKAAAFEASARTELPKGQVATLHSHAYHAIGRPKLAETTAGLKSWNEHVGSIEPEWIIEGMTSASLDDFMPVERGDTEGADALARCGVLRARMLPVEAWPVGLQAFHGEWCRWKDQYGFKDFTDFLEVALAEVDAPEWSPAVFMLDEAQDHSRLEMALARKWAQSCEQFVVVGDPDQAIFEWRGADARVFSEGEPESEIVLSQSYRVPRAVHDYAVKWIEGIEDRVPVKYEPRDADGEVVGSANTWEEDALWIAEDLEREAKQGKSVMLLASCAYMLKPTIAQLREQGLPFANPYKPTRGDWNPLKGAERLLHFLRPDAATWGDQRRPWDWEDVRRWAEALRAEGTLKRGAKSLIESKAKPPRFGEVPEAEIATLLGLFEEEHHDAIFDLDVPWWVAHHLPARRRSSEYPARVYRLHGGRALRDRPLITVGTIHSVKGGEADTVFVMPDLSYAGAQEWEDNPASVRRQFYVAFTRAREKLVLLSAEDDTLSIYH